MRKHVKRRHLDKSGNTQSLAILLFFPILLYFLSSYPAVASQSDSAAALFDNEERHAIVIGIDRYRYHTDLRFAERDAIRLGDVLEDLGYNVHKMINYEADPYDLKSLIIQIGERMESGDGRESGSLLITFAGHGYSRDGVNYLAMGRAKMAGNKDDSLSVEELLQTMRSTGIGRQFLFLDACRNSPVRDGEDAGTLPAFVDFLADRGQGVIFSTKFGSLSYEDSSLGVEGHGVFSHFLAEALANRELVNEMGYLTLDNLYPHVRKRVANYVLNTFRADQTPYRSGESTGDMKIARFSSPRIALPDLNGPSAQANKPSSAKRIWKYVGIAAGLVAVAIIAGNDSDKDDQGDGVTLIIPTP